MSKRRYDKGQLRFGEYVIAGERRDFRWTHENIKELKTMYDEGYSLSEMANYFDKRVTEVLVMLDDMLEDETIKPTRRLTLK